MNTKNYIINSYRNIFSSNGKTRSVLVLQPNNLTSIEWLAIKEKMAPHGITLHVVKNKLMFVAFADNPYRNIGFAFKGPNALAVIEHPHMLVLVLNELVAQKNKLQLLWGMIDGSVHTPNYYNKYLKINDWPTVLDFTNPLIQLIGLLSAPIVQLQYIIGRMNANI